MNIDQFQTLEVGDIVYVVINTGITGICKYQYIGVHFNKLQDEQVQVFLSEHFLSTVCIGVNNTKNNRKLKNIFLTEQEAVTRKKQLYIEERQLFED